MGTSNGLGVFGSVFVALASSCCFSQLACGDLPPADSTTTAEITAGAPDVKLSQIDVARTVNENDPKTVCALFQNLIGGFPGWEIVVSPGLISVYRHSQEHPVTLPLTAFHCSYGRTARIAHHTTGPLELGVCTPAGDCATGSNAKNAEGKSGFEGYMLETWSMDSNPGVAELHLFDPGLAHPTWLCTPALPLGGGQILLFCNDFGEGGKRWFSISKPGEPNAVDLVLPADMAGQEIIGISRAPVSGSINFATQGTKTFAIHTLSYHNEAFEVKTVAQLPRTGTATTDVVAAEPVALGGGKHGLWLQVGKSVSFLRLRELGKSGPVQDHEVEELIGWMHSAIGASPVALRHSRSGTRVAVSPFYLGTRAGEATKSRGCVRDLLTGAGWCRTFETCAGDCGIMLEFQQEHLQVQVFQRYGEFSAGVEAVLWADEFGNTTVASSGLCAKMSLTDCADPNPCTSDLCDAAHGGCFHEPLPDGVECAAGKACKAGVCVGGGK